MERPSGRRLTILDVMVLIAATAAGAVWPRWVWGDLTMNHLARPVEGWSVWSLLARVPHLLGVAVACVAPWTIALLALRLRRPRPSRRRLAVQPGFAACASATLGLAFVAADELFNLWNSSISTGQPFGQAVGAYGLSGSLFFALLARPHVVGLAVASAWLLLIIGQRWRPEPTWIDRAGRAVGAYWLAMLFEIRCIEALFFLKVLAVG